MSDTEMAAFQEELRTHIGSEGAPAPARDPVNQPMIRHWCDAMTDHNRVYTDPEFAVKSVHGEIVAPPTMLNAWTMQGNVPRRFESEDPLSNVLTRLDEAGFTSVVATNSEHEYLRYLRIGDHLEGRETVSDVSAEKRTALGIGHFTTTNTEYRTRSGEVVGRMKFRILKYRPGTGRAAEAVGEAAEGRREEVESGTPVEPGVRRSDPEPAPPPRPPRRETTLRFEEVEVGDELPSCPIPITTTLIVAGAIASRDYQDVHHDRELAVLRGSPDIFMNILTTTGLCGRYVGDWAGPEALMRRLAIRLGAPNYPHDTMTMSASVLSKNAEGGAGSIELGLRGRNRLGDHVTGTMVVELPNG
jgi:acyl dehydratase